MIRQGRNPTYVSIKSSIWQRQRNTKTRRKYRETVGKNEILSLPGIPYFLCHSHNFILCPNFWLKTSLLKLYLRDRNNQLWPGETDLLRLWFYHKYAFSLSVWTFCRYVSPAALYIICCLSLFLIFWKLLKVYFPPKRFKRRTLISKCRGGWGVKVQVLIWESEDLESIHNSTANYFCDYINYLTSYHLVYLIHKWFGNPYMDLAILDPLIVKIMSTVLKVDLSKLMPLTNVN